MIMENVKPWVKAEIEEAVRGLHNSLDNFKICLNEQLVEHPDTRSLRGIWGYMESGS